MHLSILSNKICKLALGNVYLYTTSYIATYIHNYMCSSIIVVTISWIWVNNVTSLIIKDSKAFAVIKLHDASCMYAIVKPCMKLIIEIIMFSCLSNT